MNIKTEQHMDGRWSAIDMESYDGAPDSMYGYIGFGDTSDDAIEDLKFQLEEAEITPMWSHGPLHSGRAA